MCNRGFLIFSGFFLISCSVSPAPNSSRKSPESRRQSENAESDTKPEQSTTSNEEDDTIEQTSSTSQLNQDPGPQPGPDTDADDDQQNDPETVVQLPATPGPLPAPPSPEVSPQPAPAPMPTPSTPAVTCSSGGKEVGGFCWYVGGFSPYNDSQSCTSVCTGRGGYHEATKTYAGSTGTDANCLAVAKAVVKNPFPDPLNAGANQTLTFAINSAVGGNPGPYDKLGNSGCMVGAKYFSDDPKVIRFRSGATTAGSPGHFAAKRLCACKK